MGHAMAIWHPRPHGSLLPVLPPEASVGSTAGHSSLSSGVGEGQVV